MASISIEGQGEGRGIVENIDYKLIEIKGCKGIIHLTDKSYQVAVNMHNYISSFFTGKSPSTSLNLS